MDGEERSKGEKGEEKEKGEKKEGGEVKEEEVREGVSKVDIMLDCESKKSDAKDVCWQQKILKIGKQSMRKPNLHNLIIMQQS